MVRLDRLLGERTARGGGDERDDGMLQLEINV